MELTYTDAEWRDVGVLGVTSGDFAWGTDENDFVLKLTASQEIPAEHSIVYSDGTDAWGIVRGVTREADGGVTLVGDTWTGFLGSHLLVPPDGNAYYKVSGDVRDCVAALISRLGMGDYFSVAAGAIGVKVSHTFQGRSSDPTQRDTGRYMGGWSALWQLLTEHGCKAAARYDAASRKVVLSPARAESHINSEWSETEAAAVMAGWRRPVNHLVCLGQGEGADRTVVHLYADGSGNVSGAQTITGPDLVEDVYDDSAASDATTLASDGTKKLQELWAASCSVKVAAEDQSVDLGDTVGGTDPRTGISATATVTKKVLSIDGTQATVTYETTVR